MNHGLHSIMKNTLSRLPRTQWLAIAAVVALTLVLAVLILRPGAAGDGDHDDHGDHDERARSTASTEGTGHAEPAAAGKDAHAEPAKDRVAMTDAQLRAAGIELATAGPAVVESTLRLLGEVRYDADRTVQVVPRLAGLVERVQASAGDTVRKGQVLAVLSSPGLADQRAVLLAAQRRLALARSTVEREQQLWEEKISARQDLLQAQATLEEAAIAVRSAQGKLAMLGGAPAGGDLTRYELRSPIDGVVTEKRLAPGETVKEDAPVFTISDLGSVWVEAQVAPQHLGRVVTGLPAVVRAEAFEARADARIRHIGALVGEQTRHAVARLVLPNPKGLWRPGLPVSIDVLLEAREVPVAVAVEALQDVDGARAVFVREGAALVARPLEPGLADDRHVEVRAGLRPGERYARTQSFLVKAELGKAGASHSH
ncbi:efflux RND transporter periplasmic adaptor subunit [Variovorax sp. PvP013_2]